MWHVFNMGVGFAVIVGEGEAGQACAVCRQCGCPANVIGEVAPVNGLSRFDWSN
jgi:phosphoribosylaminoimidazole (AIR) synthetase